MTRAKRCFYTKFNLSIIQDRDLLLYSYINNKLKDTVKSIQFLSKSYDNEEAFHKFKKPKINKDLIRIDLKNSSFEIIIVDSETILMQGLIFINPELKHLDANYINMVTRQYTRKWFSNIMKLLELSEGEFDAKIPKGLSSAATEFYYFIEQELRVYSL